MILLRRLRVRALKHLRDVDIWFPRRGGLLIEGHNESGKSTLFEAVYFALYGVAIVGERNSPALDDLIPHEATTAAVELAVVIGDAELDVRRTLTLKSAGRVTQHAQLSVRRPGKMTEDIHGPRAVNERLLQELGRLDGDALRNSCFMEQKALDRIESLSREKREDAVAKLLGLDRLSKIESELRAAMADQKRQVDRFKAELELAELHRLARDAVARAAEARERLRAIQIVALLDERDRETQARGELEQGNATLSERRAMLAARIERALVFQSLLTDLDLLERDQEAARRDVQARDALRARHDELTRIEHDESPPLEARLATLREAQDELRRIEDMRQRLGALDELTTARTAANQIQARCAEAEDALRNVRETAAAVAARDALQQWIRLRRIEEHAREGAAQTSLESDRAAHEAERAKAGRMATRTGALAMLMAVAAGAALLAGTRWTAATLAAVPLLALAAVCLWLWRRARTAARRAGDVLAGISRQLVELAAQRNAAQQLSGALDELPRIEAMLRACNLVVPESIASAEATLAALAEAGAPDVRDVAEQVRIAEQVVAHLHAERQAAEARVAAATRAIAPASADLSLGDLQAQEAALREEISVGAASLDSGLAVLDVPREPTAIAAAAGAAEGRLAQLRQQIAELDTLTTRLREAETLAARSSERIVQAIEKLSQRANELGADTGGLAPDIAASPDACALLRTVISDVLLRLDAQAAREELTSLGELRGSLDERSRTLHASYTDRVAAIRSLLGEQDIAATGEESRAELIDRWPLLGTADPASLTEQRDAFASADNMAHHYRQSADERARSLSLDVATLDEDQCRARYSEAETVLRQHALAAEMAQETQATIIRRVLPETEVYMRALLPELTAGRYRDVKLLSGDGADLRITVWDQNAGRYVSKRLFSGGARDQFSLALRLAFALATLPKELGVLPGFIFLDEPLSAFDAERSQALVNVLTRGTIARQFPQVVLISHSQAVERSSFAYHLRMDAGRVVDSNLPGEQQACELWELEAALATGHQV